MKIFVLDDDVEYRWPKFRQLIPPHSVTMDTTASGAISTLQRIGSSLDVIFLDHDLGGKQMVDTTDEDCGSRVVDYMALPECQIPRNALVVIHTFNPKGQEYMRNVLLDAAYTNVHVIPFGILKTKLDDPNFFQIGDN